MRLLNYATSDANPFHPDHRSVSSGKRTRLTVSSLNKTLPTAETLWSDQSPQVRSKNPLNMSRPQVQCSNFALPPETVYASAKSNDDSELSEDTYSEVTVSVATLPSTNSLVSNNSVDLEPSMEIIATPKNSQSDATEQNRRNVLYRNKSFSLPRLQSPSAAPNCEEKMTNGKFSGMTLQETLAWRFQVSKDKHCGDTTKTNGNSVTKVVPLPSRNIDTVLQNMRDSAKVKKRLAQAKEKCIEREANSNENAVVEFMAVRERLKRIRLRTKFNVKDQSASTTNSSTSEVSTSVQNSRSLASHDTINHTQDSQKDVNDASSPVASSRQLTKDKLNSMFAKRFVSDQHNQANKQNIVHIKNPAAPESKEEDDASASVHSNRSLASHDTINHTQGFQKDVNDASSPVASSRQLAKDKLNTEHSATPENKGYDDTSVSVHSSCSLVSHGAINHSQGAQKDFKSNQKSQTHQITKDKLNSMFAKRFVSDQQSQVYTEHSAAPKSKEEDDTFASVRCSLASHNTINHIQDSQKDVNDASSVASSRQLTKDKLNSMFAKRFVSDQHSQANEQKIVHTEHSAAPESKDEDDTSASADSSRSFTSHDTINHTQGSQKDVDGKSNQKSQTHQITKDKLNSMFTKRGSMKGGDEKHQHQELNQFVAKDARRGVQDPKAEIFKKVDSILSHRNLSSSDFSASSLEQLSVNGIFKGTENVSDSRDDIEAGKRVDSERENSQPSHETTKYSKMIAMGIPVGAVKNCMIRDGVNPSHVFGSNATEEANPVQKVKKDLFRRTRLHWDEIEIFSDESIWQQIKVDNEINKIVIDEEEFRSLFQSKMTVTSKLLKSPDLASDRAVKVIDPKRANNGGIILARLRMSYDNIAKGVGRIDDSILSPQQITGIMDYIPSYEERRSLQKYIQNGNDVELLCECEKFMVAIMPVKEATTKLKAMLFKLHYPTTVRGLESDLEIQTKACEEILDSIRLRKVMGAILKIGNRLNRAGVESVKTQAGGFTIESLSKLKQVKTNKKTTLLFYVSSTVRKWNESLLQVKDDMPHVIKAQKVTAFETTLKGLEQELDGIQRMAKSFETGEQGDNEPNDISIFVERASASVLKLREARNDFGQLFDVVRSYLALGDSIKPNSLFTMIASFCNDLNQISSELNKNNEQNDSRGIRKSCFH